MAATAMVWGDFTRSAPLYSSRPPYSQVLLPCLTNLVRSSHPDVKIAELGAGTGNLLRSFAGLDVEYFAVEPNPAMRAEAFAKRSDAVDGIRSHWSEGTAEKSGLPSRSVNWVVLGNVLQYLDAMKTFAECSRILQENGFLTVFWNIRDFERDPLQRTVEDLVLSMVPSLRHTDLSFRELMKSVGNSGLFKLHAYMEAIHEHVFDRARFLATWEGVNEAPSQVDEATWQNIIAEIRKVVPLRGDIKTSWITCAWTYRLV